MSPPSPRTDADRQREAAEALARVHRESETLGGSSLDALVGPPSGEETPAELWGRRIGRSLGLIAAVAMAWQLIRHFANL